MFEQTITVLTKDIQNRQVINNVYFDENKRLKSSTTQGESKDNNGLIIIKDDGIASTLELGDYIVVGEECEDTLSEIKKNRNIYEIVSINPLLFGGLRHYEIEVTI